MEGRRDKNLFFVNQTIKKNLHDPNYFISQQSESVDNKNGLIYQSGKTPNRYR